MTVFTRDGFYRRGKNGAQHWVPATTVSRDDWSRTSYGYTPPLEYRPTPDPAPTPVPPPRDTFFERYPEFEKVRRRAACFVNPNAICPVCGEIVFYYQNEHGSRVFFDELGPPWPKHPCTDTRLISARFPRFYGIFECRKPAAIEEISEWHQASGFDPEAEFTQKRGVAAWPLATIVKRIKSGKQIFLALKPAEQERASKIYMSCKSLPKCCKEGFVVAIGKAKISFFDTAAMTPKEVEVKRYRSGNAFMDAMTE